MYDDWAQLIICIERESSLPKWCFCVDGLFQCTRKPRSAHKALNAVVQWTAAVVRLIIAEAFSTMGSSKEE